MVLSFVVALSLSIPSDTAAPTQPDRTEIIDAAFSNSEAEVSEEGDSEEKVDEESAELEELRALEEVALDPSAQQSAEILRSFRRLGFANPLRERVLDALNSEDFTENSENYVLGPVNNLAELNVGQVQKEYDIPIAMQPLVAEYIRFFQGPGRKWFRRWMSRSTRFIPVMQPILEEAGLPRDTVYLAMIESGFSAKAFSWARASGPWQFIASTGKLFGLKQDFWVDERRDPIKSTEAAARYLSTLYKDLGHWYLAWAGYNAGGGKIQRVLDRKGTQDFWEISEGRGLARETKHYVPKLIACALVAKHPKSFGFSDEEFQFENTLEFDTIKLEDATDLEIIARAAQTTVQELQELNPELKRWCTPPATVQAPYEFRIPKGHAQQFTENFAKIEPSERLTYRTHQVRKGDTLSKIAATYGSASEAIMRLNGLRSSKSLRLRTVLMVPVPRRQANGRGSLALERQVARARRSGFVSRPEEEIPAGTVSKTKRAVAGSLTTQQINGKIRVTYSVQSGDSLWILGQKFDCSVDELRRWNNLSKRKKGIQIGTILTIWPGPKAQVRFAAGNEQPPASPGNATTSVAAGKT